MTTTGTVLPLCACGCGEHVATPGAKWKRGHFHRGEGSYLTALPGTEEEAREMLDTDEVLDLGEPPEVPGPPPQDGPPDGWYEEIPPDLPPVETGRTPRQARRVTATIRKDINAKISLGLEIPGRIWAARDPWCGGTFVQQRPAVADALTDIVCDSADLVEWFTGPAGGFMKYLNLGAALLPVLPVAYAHHITHTIGAEQDQQAEPDMSRYAA